MAVFSSISHDMGIPTLLNSPRDVYLIIVLRTLRTFCFGLIGLIFIIYFDVLGFSEWRIGLFMTLTQLGDVVLSLVLTCIADSVGRRTILLFGALLMILAGLSFSITTNYWNLLVAAIIGVISPTGNEIGPFRAVEESTLAHLVDKEKRVHVFGFYVTASTLTGGLGLLCSGWAVEGFKRRDGWTKAESYQALFWIYTGVGALNLLLALFLSKDCERVEDKFSEDSDIIGASDTTSPPDPIVGNPVASEQSPLLPSDQNGPTSSSQVAPRKSRSCGFVLPVSRATLPLLIRLLLLFSIDSLASGLMPWSWISFYIDKKFIVSDGSLGSFMSAAWFVCAFGNLFAGSLSSRFGIVPTMVLTHFPAAVFLALIPVPTSLWLTMVFIFARSAINQMDQAPRSAFLSAIVPDNERTAVMGTVNVVKTLSQSLGPTVTGLLADKELLWVSFVMAGSLKGLYDVGLMVGFWPRKGKKIEDDEDEARALLDGDGGDDVTTNGSHI